MAAVWSFVTATICPYSRSRKGGTKRRTAVEFASREMPLWYPRATSMYAKVCMAYQLCTHTLVSCEFRLKWWWNFWWKIPDSMPGEGVVLWCGNYVGGWVIVVYIDDEVAWLEFRLLWHGHQVMYRQLSAWMVYGLLQDHHQEFFVSRYILVFVLIPLSLKCTLCMHMKCLQYCLVNCKHALNYVLDVLWSLMMVLEKL